MTRHFPVVAVMIAIASVFAHGKAQQKPRNASILKMSVTAYCVTGETASGAQTKDGIVAADPDVLPLGSVVQIEGLKGRYDGRYRVSDTGRGIKGNELDIFIDDCAAAKRFGRQDARVRVLKRSQSPKYEVTLEP